MLATTLSRLEMARYKAFHWRFELSLTQKLILALGMAVLTGLLAQVRIPLPWTPVPITGQTFAILLSGVLLGRCWGGISQLLYVGLGVAGIPWFINWQGGIGHLAGPTGGYLIGFILAAFLIGYLTDKYVGARSFWSLLGLLLLADFIVVFIPGLVQLGLWLNLVNGTYTDPLQVLSLGFFPFVVGDIFKIILAAGIAWGLTPKRDFR